MAESKTLINDESDDNYIIVAAIDFGTSFSGYAYSYHDKPNDVIMNKEWGHEMGITSYKTPTAVLTDRYGTFVDFGYSAQKKYSERGKEKQQQLFDSIKMILYQTANVDSTTTVASRDNTYLPLRSVIAMALKYLYEHMRTELQKSTASCIDDSLIKVVLTVPAIWSHSAKAFMREAAIQAGIVDEYSSNRLTLALEPEAASYWCRRLSPNDFNPEIVSQKLPIGTKYMVVDCGGGTVDITAHELVGKDEVKEIHAPSGRDFGGTNVDRKFVNCMKDLWGKEFIEKYVTKCPQQWLLFMNHFEFIKRNYHASTDDRLGVMLPYNLSAEYERGGFFKSTKKKMKSAKGRGFHYEDGKIYLTDERVKLLFDETIHGIVSQVDSLLQIRVLRNTKYIFMVGGFSDSDLVYNKMKSQFANKNRHVLRPLRAGTVVLKGAVLYGHAPKKIKSRIARLTYGTSVHVRFDPLQHDDVHKVIIDGATRCRNVFETWIQKNESVNVDDKKTFTHLPHSQKSTDAYIPILAVDREDIKYSTDEGVQTLAEVYMNIPDAHLPKELRQIKFDISFGGTELIVNVKDMARLSGDQKEVKVRFVSK